MALTDFLKKKYEELTAPRLSQPRPNASQVVQNAVVNSIPIVGSLNSFMGRNNGGVNPNLNLGKVAQQFPAQVASIGRVGKIGTTYAQNLTNRTLNPVYKTPILGGLINSVVNEPFNVAQRQADFFQKPNLKTGASYIGSGALLASNFAIPAVKLSPKQGLLAQVPNVLKQSSVKVGLPAAGGVALDTYGQGGSREDILRNAYQTYLMSTGLGVAFPVGGRAITNSIKGVNNVLTPKPQTSFLDSGIGGKGSPVTSTTRNALEKPLAVEPFKDEGKLSTTTLSKLEGKTTVKKQFIQDLTNAPDLKQNERELIRTVLDDYGDTVDVKDFAKKVKAELLPLKARTSEYGLADYEASGRQMTNRYENITLPDELRGNVQNYNERIYESPVKTSAGNVHFPGSTDKYFGHTRVEDMADISPQQAMENALKTPGQIQPDITSKTRRVIEIQSDLYQKGNLEKEGMPSFGYSRPELARTMTKAEQEQIKGAYADINANGSKASQTSKDLIDTLEKKAIEKLRSPRNAEIAKLQQYNDPTAHFRMIREEVKRAAEDGKTKLQFPTGETAMKIEGLGQTQQFHLLDANSGGQMLNPENMKIGSRIERTGDFGNEWIITDVLGDGKFKAVPKEKLYYLEAMPRLHHNVAEGVIKEGIKKLQGGLPHPSYAPMLERQGVMDEIADFKKLLDAGDFEHLVDNAWVEQFDISSKVDQDNPIYKFYEKEVGKYLKNKYNAELVTDAQGVTWWEVDLKGKGFESKPVTAFLETKKPSDPLTQEARKYKSAEEFVKAQGETLYHGTPYEFTDFKKGKTTFFTPDKNFAEEYGSSKSFARGLDADVKILERQGKLNLFDSKNPEHIKKIKRLLPEEIDILGVMPGMGGKIPKLELLERIQGTFTHNTPKFAKEATKVGQMFDDMSIKHEGWWRIKEIKKNSVIAEKIENPNYAKNKQELKVYRTEEFPRSGTYKTQGEPYWKDFEGDKAFEDAIRNAGFDGYKMTEKNSVTYGVFNPEKLLSKSQLTDIWNKANKSKTEQSFLGINNPKKESRPITINPLKSDAEKVGISESSLRRALPKLSRKPPATPQPPDRVVFRDELNRVLGKQASGELRAVKEAIPFTKVDNKEAEAIIDAIQDPKANIPTYAKYGDYIKNIRAKFDELFKEAEDTGMDIGYRENYLPQIWKETETEIAEKMASVRGGFKFKKERKIPTYAEGKSLGLTPKYTHPAELIEAWVRNFERAKANFEFSQRLQQKGIIVPGDLVSPALPNYRAITAGGFPTSQNNIPFYAPKEIADAINTAFEIKESPRLLDITAKVSSKVQDIGLSGGIPRTPINAFSVAQVVKEVTSGRIVSPIASAFRATFGDFRKYVDKNVDVIREIQEAGTPLRLNTSIRNFLDQSTGERIFGRSFNEAWNKNISEATFGKFMPMLQVEFYKDVKAQALKSGMGNDEAIKVANKALRNFYGLADMATDATRSKVTSDIWTTLVFAPRYREAMIRFWVNNAKAMKNPTALENRQNVKFIIGAVISAVVYDLLNRQFNEGRGILDNPPGKEDKLLIPLDDGRTIGVPFLSSIATLPRTAFKIGKNVVTGDFKQAGLEAKALGSFAYKPLLDIIQNEDYFGNKIVDDDSKNAVRDRFAYLTKAYAHPYMRELLNAYAPDWLATKSQQDVPVSQRLMQAFELPIRFYKTSGIKGSYYYKAKDDNLKKLSTKERELYDKLNSPSEVDDAGLPVYNIRSEMANALDRLSNPKITAVETKIALDTARSTGEKPNPFYLLSPKQQETVLLLKTFYPGDKTKSEITNANKSWLEPYWKARDEFIGGLKAKGVIKENPSFNQRPQPTPQLQSKLDFYNTLPSGTGARSSFIRANADVEQFFNDSRNYTNSQRADLGLPLLAGYSSSGRGRKPKKLRAIKIKIPKIKTAKIKKPKKIKMYSLKKIKSKKIKLRTSLT